MPSTIYYDTAFRKRGFSEWQRGCRKAARPAGTGSADPQGGHKGNWNNDEPYRTSYHVMRKNAHSVFPQNRFWVKGAIGWVFRVPAPILGCYAMLRSWAQYPHLPIAPTAFTEGACPPSPRHVPPHAAKFPHVPFPFDAIIVFLLIKQLSFPPCFPPARFGVCC